MPAGAGRKTEERSPRSAGFAWRAGAAAIAMLGLAMVTPEAAHALSINEYFTYSYTLQLDRTTVVEGETFKATVSGTAVCKKDLPVTPSAAAVTSRIVARHTASGAVAVLNAGYTLSLTSFPTKQGESAARTLSLPLAFPQGSPAGEYRLVAEIVEARVRVVVWLDITGLLPQSENLASVFVQPAPVIPEVPGLIPPGYVDADGAFTRDYGTESDDGRGRITILRGTSFVADGADPPRTLLLTALDEPPAFPPDTAAATPVYDAQPAGTGFSQPVTVTVTYEDSALPEGANEERLALAVWSEQASEWRHLDSRVDPQANTVTAETDTLMPFVALAGTRPAAFAAGDLVIEPAMATIDQRVQVSVRLANTGDLAGEHHLRLKVDGEEVAAAQVTLAGGDSHVTTFIMVPQSPGTFEMRVGGLVGTLTVAGEAAPDEKAPAAIGATSLLVSPSSTAFGRPAMVSVVVANAGQASGTAHIVLKVDGKATDSAQVELGGGETRELAFTVVPPGTGEHQIEVGGLTSTVTVVAGEPEVPATAETSGAGDAWVGWVILAGTVLGACSGVLLLRRLRARAR